LFGRSHPSGAVVLDARYDSFASGLAGLAIQRAALFNILYEKVLDAPITVASGRAVSGADEGTVHFADNGTEGPFDLIVDALGVRSALSMGTPGRELDYGALWATLDWPQDAGFASDTLEQRYFQASEMAGILPVGTVEAGAPEKVRHPP
jgi:2-polyprenyl-6-methoxyphenol hydroxylase-like FAD-dependent oxidoreductase